MCLFRQFADPASCGYTYVIADADAGEAAVIDPLAAHTHLVTAYLHEMNLKRCHVAYTHRHAGDVAGVPAPAPEGAAGTAELHGDLREGSSIIFGDEVLRAIGTPGHTASCVSLLWRGRVFTGDALLIGGCGRTDFAGGDAGALYDSITNRLFVLPGETLVYPAHDYAGRTVSSIAEERARNSLLAGRTRDEFITLMSDLQAGATAARSTAQAVGMAAGATGISALRA